MPSLPDDLCVEARFLAHSKYGENPQQVLAALYALENDDPLSMKRFVLYDGQPPSYVNWTDIDRGLETLVRLAATFEKTYETEVPFIAIVVKHGNVCGVGVGRTPAEAAERMVEGNPRAMFGGIVLTNFRVSPEVAEIMIRHLAAPLSRRVLDGVVAPEFESGAPEVFHRKEEGKCRLMVNPALGKVGLSMVRSDLRIRQLRGGFLVQESPQFIFSWGHPDLEIYGEISKEDREALLLAKPVCDTTTSNTMTVARVGRLEANAAGQQERGGAVRLARSISESLGRSLEGAVAASDSFFPATDGPELLIQAGIRAVLATSGSIRDKEVIKTFRDAGVGLALIPDKVARGFYGH